jgi:hypothetical protein
MQRQRHVTLVLVFACAGSLLGQPTRSDPVDLQSRFGAQLKLNLPQKWGASLGYEARMISDASEFHGSYYDAELGREVAKHLSLFGNYRLARVTGDPVSHRFGVGAEVERKSDRYSLAFRPMFQYQHAGLDDAEQGSSDALRTRLKLKVPAGKRFSFYGSVEPYFAFTGIYPVDNWRNTVGADWEFMKKRKLGVYYIYRPDYSKEWYNRTYHIIGAEVSSELAMPREKARKKKK